jgi:hypothetical protein
MSRRCGRSCCAAPDEPAVWKVLLPSAGGAEDLHSTHRFLRPDTGRLTTWLTPIVGTDHAAELADAVNATPPPTAGWRSTDGVDGSSPC